MKTNNRAKLQANLEKKFTKMEEASDSKLKIIGVTGEKGKTMTSLLIHHILQRSGRKAAVLNSIGYEVGEDWSGKKHNSENITRKQLDNLVEKVKDEDVEFFVLEMTETKIRQGIFNHIELSDGVITTTIQQFEENDEPEEKLFSHYLKFINLLQTNSGLFINNRDEKLIKYLQKHKLDFPQSINAKIIGIEQARNINFYLNGSSFEYAHLKIETNLIGSFNILNMLFAISATEKYTGILNAKRAIEKLEKDHGRLHVVEKGKRFIVVDYAKNRNELEQGLKYLNITRPSGSRIITIAGSSKDQKKERKVIGNTIMQYSDSVFLVPLDPEKEKMFYVNSDIIDSIDHPKKVVIERIDEKNKFSSINISELVSDLNVAIQNGDVPIISFDENGYSARLDAIRLALEHSREGDIIYIPGKGHESFMDFGNVKYEWSDYEALNIALKDLGFV